MPQNYKNQPSINRFNFCKWYQDKNLVANGEFELGSGNNFTNWTKSVPTHTNLLQYSNDFTNAYWSKLNATINPNTWANYGGQITAHTIIADNGSGNDRLIGRTAITVVNGNKYTHSILARKKDYDWVILYGLGAQVQWFNLATGQLGNTSGTGTGEIIPIGVNGWYLISFTVTASSSSGIYYHGPVDGNGTLVCTSDGTKGTYVSDAQLEPGEKATSRIFTTSSSLTEDDGSILPATRTNLQRQSEDITNASCYSVSSLNLSSNQIIDPRGNLKGDLASEVAAFARHELYSDTYVFTGKDAILFYVKDNGTRYLSVISGGDPGLGGATFDLQLGVITSITGGVTPTIKDKSDGWYECSVPFTRISSGSQVYFCYRTNGGSPSVETYLGDANKGIYFGGIQFESNVEFSSEYIATENSAVTVQDGLNASRAVKLTRGVTDGLALNYAALLGAAGKYKLKFWAKTASESTSIKIISDSTTFDEFTITNREYQKFEMELDALLADNQLRFFNTTENSSLIIDNVTIDLVEEGSNDSIPNPYTLDNEIKYFPLLVNGDKFRFYINADTPITGLTFSNLRLALYNSEGVRMYSDSNINSLTVGAGIHIYSNDITLSLSSYPDGIYYWALIDIATGTTKYTSNYFRLVSSGYNDYSTTIEYSHYKTMYNYRYSSVSFSNKFRVHILLSDIVYGGEISEYQEISTGTVRKTSTLKQRIYKVETYYFDRDAHEAMQIMCEHNNININNKAYLAKGVYSPNIEQISNVSKGEAEFIDQEYSQLNN